MYSKMPTECFFQALDGQLFYLFDDIEKNIKITHVNHSATSKAILTKMLVQPEHLYFLFAFCARNYPW